LISGVKDSPNSLPESAVDEGFPRNIIAELFKRRKQ